jgi:hypothetical protein
VFWRTKGSKLEGENLQEVYLLHFFAKPGAEKSQLGVFGCSKSIGIGFKRNLETSIADFSTGKFQRAPKSPGPPVEEAMPRGAKVHFQ